MSEPNQFDKKSVSEYWLEEAQEALQVAGNLVDSGDNSYALFFGHLAVEKILKALFVIRHNEHAPRIHSLSRLADLAGVALSEKQAEELDLITSFHLEARYPDEKRSFRQKCTPQYTRNQMAAIQEIFSWLRSLL